MATMRVAPLSTRSLVHVLSRIPRARNGASGLVTASVKPFPCAPHVCVQLGSQQRGIFGWGKPKDDDGDVGGNGKEADAKGKEVEAKGSSNPSNEKPSPTESIDASDGAIVPISAGELRQDTGPAFEPRMVAVPLLQRPIVPGQHQMVQITNKDTIEEIMKSFAGGSPVFIATFLRKQESLSDTGDEVVHGDHEDLSGNDPLQVMHATGTRARVVQAAPFSGAGKDDASGGEGLQMLLHGRDLVNLDKVLAVGPPLQVQVSRIRLQKPPAEGPAADEIKAYINETMHTVREIMKINPQFREHAALIHQGMQRMEHGDPHSIAHFAACLTTAAGEELMQVLEAADPSEKLRTVLTLLKKELELSQLQQKITTQIKEKVDSHQREFMLREQLKMIKNELGEGKSDGTDILLQKFKTRLEGKTVPQDAKEAIDSEIDKLSGLAKESQEYQITRNYLDWLTVLPWGLHSQDTLSLRKARTILDKDHHGLADVKERILELIAVGRLRGSVQGKIVCFVGPPGVGKTSIGKSIAEALGRKFYRFSVGGLYDVAEIKGHRRTYVGAMPGKVVQCLKKTQSANPLVLIDEIDKIGRGHQGDPASALLELLDPSQNSSFMDHYLDVPVDASKILFVCTANVTDTIPGPLLDRMEVIRLSGYDLQEKLKIAEDYLVPSSMRELGLWPLEDASVADEKETIVAETSKDGNVDNESKAPEDSAGDGDVDVAVTGGAPEAKIEQGAVEALIRWYCREAGVRNLQKHIEKICRKLAMKVVERREALEETTEGTPTSAETSDPPSEVELVVSEDKLSDLVGKPLFTSDRLYEDSLPAGTVTGLAWTALGGSVLYMEATALPRHEGKSASPTLSVTGQLGSVMKESSQLALLLARRELATLGKSPSQKSFFNDHELHLHCPEGATPKDGPSAGITMVTALLSLGLDTPVRADLAMTGEVSLNGKVLAIGGVKEKTIGARRAGCKALVFPKANRRDFDELPDYLKEGLEVHFATDYSDVFPVAFPDY